MDPLGYIGGLNLYTYVKNNSTNRIDPYGLLPNQNQIASIIDWVAWVTCEERKLETIGQLYGQSHPFLMERRRDLLEKILAQGIILDPRNRTRPAPRYLYNVMYGIDSAVSDAPIHHYLDALHFFRAAHYATKYGQTPVEVYGEWVEIKQFFSKWDRHSAFAPEDLASNRAGAIFGSTLDLTKPLAPQLQAFLQSIGAWPPGGIGTNVDEFQCDLEDCERMKVVYETRAGKKFYTYTYYAGPPDTKDLPGYETLSKKDDGPYYRTHYGEY